MRYLSHFFTSEIAQAAGFIAMRSSLHLDPAVTGLAYDSRKVEQGNLYFALPGLHYDGHRFVPEAVAKGAAVIVHQNELGLYHPDIVYIKLKAPRFGMSPIADAFYGFPSKQLSVIGVTGTEGKSTTVYLCYQLLRYAGTSSGFISTVQFDEGTGEQWNPEHQTTPEAPTVHRLLAAMRDQGLDYAVLEASSHGLSPKTNRLGDVAFDAAVLTNVTHEHLEFHGTWEQYREDKANLFRRLDIRGGEKMIQPFGVINADDPSAAYFAGATKQPTYTYSTQGAQADLRLQRIESTSEGNQYEVLIQETHERVLIQDRLPGAFNAGNVLAAVLTVSRLLSMPVNTLIPLIGRLKPVKGRMTAIRQGQPFEVLVDFAHTPSSFQAVFPPLRSRLDKRRGRIISLFGSAGERDTKKRREQGRIASAWSDIIILTDEDPRGEEPIAILEEIAKGIHDKKIGDALFLLPDRPEAVRKAFALAQDSDLVLLLGKGHENSIIYAAETRAYDEITEAENALMELGYPKKEEDL
ncbi:MAG: UDP-N-acetylmuramoyl-L-alanyl-D-glutamate--2,6-diaminopimelate ligase [Treponema sp.]|jgi:UDP-N-acetylmuramoyl-L-alanyl-D-glutamate--2,6-diaminopimelate ligase|nr:UDP-N-acetylmuramoyl-L-alanyl-D-glutamate--2,6-diaminopimelate ligase [Treponema sp.]